MNIKKTQTMKMKNLIKEMIKPQTRVTSKGRTFMKLPNHKNISYKIILIYNKQIY